MRKMQILYLFFTLLLLGSTCNKENEECHRNITIVNTSENSIYVWGDTYYPDTTYFGHYSGLTENAYHYKISAKSSSDRPLQNRDCWETVFSYGVQIPSDTLMIFIFDAEVLETEEWSNVVHSYKVLKRYDLSLADLKRMNWTIIYP